MFEKDIKYVLNYNNKQITNPMFIEKSRFPNLGTVYMLSYMGVGCFFSLIDLILYVKDRL